MANGAVLLKWRDRNWAEHGHYIYRSDTPMDINNLPSPIETLTFNQYQYIDYDVIADQTYYYRIGAFRNNDVSVSEEIEVVATPMSLDDHDAFGDGSGVALFMFDGNITEESGSYVPVWVGAENYTNGLGDGLAANFTGSNFIRVPFTDLDENTPFSISCWLYNGGNTYKARTGIWGIGTPTTSNQISSYQNSGTGYIGIDFFGNTTFSSTTAVLGTGWDHVVWTYDASNLSDWRQSISIYVNGNLLTLQSERMTSVPLNISPSELVIGGLGDPTYNPTIIIDHFRLFSKSLSFDEIQQLYREFD